MKQVDKQKNGQKLSGLWIQATVFGSLWGALEITLGTMLHALRIPFSGVWMASAGIILIVAGYFLYPYRGFAIRVGVVCMLLKMVAPGVVIVMPMIGIIVESLVIEFVLGRKKASYPLAALAGGIATLSVIIQTMLYYYLIFGWDLLKIYFRLLKSTIRYVGAGDGAEVWAVVLIVTITFSIGAIAGAYGLRLGKEVKRLRGIRENAR